MTKIKVGLCFIWFWFLLCFAVLVVASTRTDTDSRSSNADQSQNRDPDSDSELSLVLQRFAQIVEKKNREQGKVIDEMKRQIQSLQSAQETCKAEVKSLSQKVHGLESKISSDRGVWLLTPPLRGPPGKQGAQGQEGQKGEKGETGKDGQDGKAGTPGRDGTDGVKGATGEQGLPGMSGKDGRAGISGRNGTDGVKGPKGDRGLPAPQSISSCNDARENLHSPRSKKQTIYPHGNNKRVEVVCDFETDGGGWTIIQKRTSGPKQEFQKNWNEYESGFGSAGKNYWIGLENIHALTKNRDQELRIELEDFEGNKKYAKYSSFSVSSASDFYRLTVSGFSGTVGDSMTNPNYQVNNGKKFSTKDQDNDNYSGGSCVAVEGGGGGWWFNACGFSNLNGLYFEKGETVPFKQGIYWYSWKGTWTHSLAKTEMKIRKRK